MNEPVNGKVHYLWIIIAVLATALIVILGVVAYNAARPNKPAMTPEEEREHLLDYITREGIKDIPAMPGDEPYEKRYRDWMKWERDRNPSLEELRKMAKLRYNYTPPR